MYPWKISFVDSSAVWIWNDAYAASSAPVITVEFVKSFYAPANHPCVTESSLATIYMNIDNRGTAYVNGNQILESSDWTRTATSNFMISSGINVLRILATNEEVTPAGLLVSVYCQNTLMLHSDDSWCSGE